MLASLTVISRASSGWLRTSDGDGIEGVEEEVGIDLALQGVEAGLKQEALLLFELELDAQGVPDLERDADDHGRAEPDQHLQAGDVGVEREEAMRIKVRQPFAADLQNDDEEQHHDLAVEAGLAEVAAHPAPEAEVDEGGEGPDLVHLDKAAEEAGGQAERGVEGQSQVLMVKDGGDGEDDAAEHGPSGTDEEAKENDGFKGDVGGEEVGDLGADPDAEGERHEEKGQQGRGLAVAAILGKEQPLEGAGPGQRAGHRGGHAQLDQQRDEDERIGHPINVQCTVDRCRD